MLWLLVVCVFAQVTSAQDWTLSGSLTYGRYRYTATLLPNGNVLVAAGFGSTGWLNSAELYNTTTGLWTVTGFLTYPRDQHTATLLPNGNVLVAGGYYYSNNYIILNSAELYNPSTSVWTETGSLTFGRTGHTGTLLPNGNVLVAGGEYYNNGYIVINSAEVYNPTTGLWTVTGSLTYARDQHTATLLPNGNVLVAGGYNNGFLNSAELYNATTGNWTVTGSLTYVRDQHTATLLPNGNVLVAGGGYPPGYVANSDLDSAELYNVTTGLWTVTGSLIYARNQHTATLLPNGNVLVAGGQSATGGQLNSAEFYNAATGVWTVTGSLMYLHSQHTATLLPKGNVLVAAGCDGSGCEIALDSAELYITTNSTFLPEISCCSFSTGVYFEIAPTSDLTMNCVNCQGPINFSNLFLDTFPFATFQLICTNCTGFTELGVFPQNALPSMSLSCINCPSLQSFGDFSSLATTSSALSLLCSNCSSLRSLGNFPLLSDINSLLSFSCINCPSISVLGNFPLLSTNSPIALSCTNCPALTTPLFPSLQTNQPATSITFTCNPCSSNSFTPDAPIFYVFSDFVPQEISSVAPAASLTFSNAILPVSLNFVGLFRLNSLSFLNIVAGTNVDFLVELNRVDGSITIQNATFTNIDGITTSLAQVGSVFITDNPVLCNINTNKFETTSASPPIISNNGFNTMCSILDPVAPFKPSLVSFSSSTVQLNWTLPQQPSVSTTYALTINGVAFLTFQSWNPVIVPYTVTSLSASSTYTFVITATLGAISVNSPSLIVTTDAGVSSGCPFGYYKPSGSCLPCGVAQFPSDDFLSCVSCPSGTFANSSALASSASCQLCPSGTYASSSQSTQCSSCPSSNNCPLGATAALSSTIYSSPANETSTSSSTNNGFPFGYIYLIVLFGLAFVTGLVVVILPKPKRSIILKFAVLIPTPRFLFRVNPENWRILELPSVIRGLIGLWMLLGLIVVTAYQINNFVVNQFGSSSYIQPGTKFSSGQHILSATTTTNITIMLFASPITCDPSLFSTSSTINGAVSCTSNATTTTFTLTTTLSSLPSSATNLQLTITATNGNLAYTPALQYSFTSLSYNNLNYSVSETIVGGSNAVVTGTTTINIAAVATESLDVNGVTLNTGYDFSYISTSASTSNSSSSSLVLSFQISVPQYFLQVRQVVVVISSLLFISGLLAIGGGVIAVGTLLAFVISYAAHHWLRTGAFPRNGSAIELVKSSKQDPSWI